MRKARGARQTFAFQEICLQRLAENFLRVAKMRGRSGSGDTPPIL
jgi:hypothetical protein